MTRGFRQLWAAAGLSNLGDGMSQVAVPLLAVTLTRDPVLVGLLTGMLFLPYLLLSVPVGVLVDRVDPRSAMLVANVVRAAALAVLCVGVAAGFVTIVWLYVLVIVYGATEAVYDTAATTSAARLVDADALDGANARLQGTITVTNNFLGAPVGAVAFAAAAVAPFGLHAALVVAASLIVARLPRLRTPATASRDDVTHAVGSVWAQTGEGLSWLLRHPTLRTLALVSAGAAFALQIAQATVVLYAIEELGVPEAAFGAFAMAAAAGAVTGAFVAPRLARRFGRMTVMLGSGTVQVASLVGLALAPSAVVGAATFAGSAAAVGTWNVLSVSLRQRLVPERLFGRVLGAWKTLVWGALPLGSWVGGLVASAGGLRAPWLVGAVLYATALGLGASALRRAATDAHPVSGPDARARIS